MYNFDHKLADGILDIVMKSTATSSSGIKSSLLELGAGTGCYTHYLYQSKVFDRIVAYEGAANVENFVLQADLAQLQDYGGASFDWVVSLEVAEHIPPEYKATFVANILAPSPQGIILSWAIPNQVGTGHVNCRSKSNVDGLPEVTNQRNE